MTSVRGSAPPRRSAAQRAGSAPGEELKREPGAATGEAARRSLRQPRSEATRRRILQSARYLFANDGFERTTIRAIASTAQIDPALVIRYFGNKAGLFAAAAEFDLGLPCLADYPPSERGQRLVEHFLNVWEGPRSGQEFPLLLRAATSQVEAFEKLQSIFEHQLVPAIGKMVGPKRAKDTAALISTQILGIALTRYVLRLPAVTALSRKTIIERVGPVLQSYIDIARERP